MFWWILSYSQVHWSCPTLHSISEVETGRVWGSVCRHLADIELRCCERERHQKIQRPDKCIKMLNMNIMNISVPLTCAKLLQRATLNPSLPIGLAIRSPRWRNWWLSVPTWLGSDPQTHLRFWYWRLILLDEISNYLRPSQSWWPTPDSATQPWLGKRNLGCLTRSLAAYNLWTIFQSLLSCLALAGPSKIRCTSCVNIIWLLVFAVFKRFI